MVYKVLAIDHDFNQLCAINSFCQLCHYQFTPFIRATDAMNLLLGGNTYFDVILIEINMPDMDSFDFLDRVNSQFKIPVIMMSYNASYESLMKSVTYGACDYWPKPLVMQQFEKMWLHNFRKVWREENKPHKNLRFFDDECNRKLTREDDSELKEDDDSVPNETGAKKTRLSWTNDLHQKFLTAVNQLGIDKAVSKDILKLMNVPGLTKEQISSHMQKHKIRLKRSIEETKGGRIKSKFSVFDFQETRIIETQLGLEAGDHQVSETTNDIFSKPFDINGGNIVPDSLDLSCDLKDSLKALPDIFN